MRISSHNVVLVLLLLWTSSWARGTLEGSSILTEARQILTEDKRHDALIREAASDVNRGSINVSQFVDRRELISREVEKLNEFAISQSNRYEPKGESLGTALRTKLLNVTGTQLSRVRTLIKAAQAEELMGEVKARPLYERQIQVYQAYQRYSNEAYQAFFLDPL